MIDIFFIILQVILLDGILSIDNAAALGTIASVLPKHEQGKALKYGIIGAYVGRSAMLLFVGFFLAIPLLKLLAAGYLLYLCGVHFFKWPPLFNFTFKGLSNFWKTVIIIEIADLAFSVDNVAAVVALSSNIWIIIIGVCISILMMRFFAQMFIRLLEKEPLLEHAAYLIIFCIAIELGLQVFGIHIPQLYQFLLSIGIIIGTFFVSGYKRNYLDVKEVVYEK